MPKVGSSIVNQSIYVQWDGESAKKLPFLCKRERSITPEFLPLETNPIMAKY